MRNKKDKATKAWLYELETKLAQLQVKVQQLSDPHSPAAMEYNQLIEELYYRRKMGA